MGGWQSDDGDYANHAAWRFTNWYGSLYERFSQYRKSCAVHNPFHGGGRSADGANYVSEFLEDD